MDIDVRGDDEVGLGATRTGPPAPPFRDGEVAVVLGRPPRSTSTIE
jgi:hypothetical protein